MSNGANGGSRAATLAALRRRSGEPVASPDISGPWLQTGDRAAQQRLFERMLESAGGRCKSVTSRAELQTALDATPEFAEAKLRLSLVPGTHRYRESKLADSGLPGTNSKLPGTDQAYRGDQGDQGEQGGVVEGGVGRLGGADVEVSEISHPAGVADLDFALLPGVFGVAENGAVWIDGAALPHRSLLVLPEHLGIVLPADALVDHMHAAYERLPFDAPGFGCFVSGPSKTADIEQALIIGAHGARSLTVFLLQADADADAEGDAEGD